MSLRVCEGGKVSIFVEWNETCNFKVHQPKKNFNNHFFIDKNVRYPLDKTYVNNVYDQLQNILFTKYEDKSTECGSTCLIVCHYREFENDYINSLPADWLQDLFRLIHLFHCATWN